MTDTVVSLTHVGKVYKMDGVNFTALENISFSISRGEFTTIMGPSGSGKSTLMHLIGCLDTPTTGEIAIDGKNTSKLKEAELARIRNQKIGFVFQQFNLLKKTSALANVELPLIYAKINRKVRHDMAKQFLEKVGLGEKLDNYPSQLSGGQQQRVAIARALVNNPSLILADEPSGNLDSKSGKEVMKIFEQLHTEGTTIIVVTHDPIVAAHAKRTIRIADGQIIKNSND